MQFLKCIKITCESGLLKCRFSRWGVRGYACLWSSSGGSDPRNFWSHFKGRLPIPPDLSSLEIVTLQCAETTPEESPGPVRAEGGKASKSGWVGQGNGLEGSPEKVISDLNLEGWGRVYQTHELEKEHSRQIRLGQLFLFSPVDEKGNRHHLWVFVKELGSPVLVSSMSQRRRKCEGTSVKVSVSWIPWL